MTMNYEKIEPLGRAIVSVGAARRRHRSFKEIKGKVRFFNRQPTAAITPLHNNDHYHISEYLIFSKPYLIRILLNYTLQKGSSIFRCVCPEHLC